MTTPPANHNPNLLSTTKTARLDENGEPKLDSTPAPSESSEPPETPASRWSLRGGGKFRAQKPVERRYKAGNNAGRLRALNAAADEGGLRWSKRGARPYYQVPFAESLREVVKPGSTVRENVYVRDTPQVLQDIGMTALPVMASPRHLRLNYYDGAGSERTSDRSAPANTRMVSASTWRRCRNCWNTHSP